jgi:hypothetical protein
MAAVAKTFLFGKKKGRIPENSLGTMNRAVTTKSQFRCAQEFS